MGKKIEDLQEEAKELKIELKGDEKYNELQTAIKIKKEENAEDKKKADKKIADDKVKADAKAKKIADAKKKVYFYNVKVKAFKNDTKRVEIGLYQAVTKVKRFEKMADEYVERFDGKIPSPKLHEIAKKFKVSIYTDGKEKEVREDKYILADLVQKL